LASIHIMFSAFFGIIIEKGLLAVKGAYNMENHIRAGFSRVGIMLEQYGPMGGLWDAVR